MTKQKATIQDVYKLLEDLRDEVREIYVTRAEFLPVKLIAFGIVGAASATVLTAVLAKTVIASFTP